MDLFEAPVPRPWRVLSLDGGGVKGLAELLVLKRLFRVLADKLGLEGDLRPCDYFDLIGGTSTGGLIAIMVGRLRMTVPEAIVHFRALSPVIFKGRKLGPLEKFFRAETGKTYFEAEDMVNSIE